MKISTTFTPNFFILGSAKSGTTSLYHLLKRHPDIFLTAKKEPSFFNEGFHVVNDAPSYFSLYDSATTEKFRGEASHAYLTCPQTPRLLKALFPSAKFIVILRHPAERAYSLYHHMRRNGYEYCTTFEQALDIEHQRITSPKFKRDCKQYYHNYLYFNSGLYAEQLSRYFSYFPKEQFHILSLSQLTQNPQETLNEVFDFFSLDHIKIGDPSPKNTGQQTVRYPGIEYLVKVKLERPLFVRKICRSLLKRTNRYPTPEMLQETREILNKRYADDLEKLYQLTGVNFND